MQLGPVHPLAVLAAAVATMIIGAAWYAPMGFGKMWVAAHGYTPADFEEMKKSMGRTYSLSVLAYLLMGTMMSLLLTAQGGVTLRDGAILGFVCWLGFAATIGGTTFLFSNKKPATYWIDTTYQLVYMVVMGVIIAAWR